MISVVDREFKERFQRQAHCPFARQFGQLLRDGHMSPDKTDSEDGEIELAEMRSRTLAQVTNAIEWPAIPSILQQLDKVLSSPDASSREIAEVVQTDPALTIRILNLINSPAYTLVREIDSLEQAISLLGAEQIRNAAVGASVVKSFTGQNGFDADSFWLHSLAVALACRLIGSVLSNRGMNLDSGSLFLAGLLHDIGRVVIVQQLPEHQKQIRAAQDAGVELLEAELAVTGMCHTDFGRNLLADWNVNENITLAAAYHHAPVDQGVYPNVVHCADAMAHGLGYAYREQGFPRLNPQAWEVLGLTNKSIRLIAAKLIEQIDDLTKSMLR